MDAASEEATNGAAKGIAMEATRPTIDFIPPPPLCCVGVSEVQANSSDFKDGTTTIFILHLRQVQADRFINLVKAVSL